MLLHASHAAQHGHQKILIQTDDTNVVVLAVLAFGTGKGLRYLAAHEVSAGLGLEKARALLMFHALTGCDTVSNFAGHRKKIPSHVECAARAN